MAHFKDILGFLIGTVLVKYIILKWAVEKFGDLMQWILVRTKKQAIVWVHYEKRAMKNGHHPKNPIVCSDGKCTEV